MELNNLNIEELSELRTKLLLEGKDTNHISLLIDCKESEYIFSILEDDTGGSGVALANGSISGMGAVVSPQPSSFAGVTSEPGYSAGGGSAGSGDIGVPFNANGKGVFQKVKVDNRHGSSKRRKNKLLAGLKSVFANRQDFTAGQGKDKPKKIMSFDSFSKNDFNKVTHVKQ